MQQDQIWIEDLGSTNGTFVNGEKIKRARLKEGDRVLFGKWSGTEVKLNGQDLLIMKESDIMGVISQ